MKYNVYSFEGYDILTYIKINSHFLFAYAIKSSFACIFLSELYKSLKKY